MKDTFDFSFVYQITDKMVESGQFTALQVENVERALKAEKIYEDLLFDYLKSKTAENPEIHSCFDIKRGIKQRKQLE